MKVTSPHMGVVEYLLDDLFERLNVCYFSPPKTSSKTLKLGVKYAPEFACLPLKINIGNFIEALEVGADTLIMAGGTGPCRFGYYAQVQKQIVESLGYDFEMVVIEPPAAELWDFIHKFKYFAPHMSIWRIWKEVKTSFRKAQVFDEIEKKVLECRAYEVNFGDTSRSYKKAINIIKKARSPEEIASAREQALSIVDGVKKDSARDVLRVGIVGEFYVLLEPFVNFDIEEFLGNKGVYLERAVYITDWIGISNANPVSGVSDAEMQEKARGYLSHFVGGEGQATIGHIVKFAQEGFDGVIHLFPFTCMPETIAKSIFSKLSRELDVPILSLVIDEQTGKAGVTTRLEAFIDLLRSKRRAKEELVEGKRKEANVKIS